MRCFHTIRVSACNLKGLSYWNDENFTGAGDRVIINNIISFSSSITARIVIYYLRYVEKTTFWFLYLVTWSIYSTNKVTREIGVEAGSNPANCHQSLTNIECEELPFSKKVLNADKAFSTTPSPISRAVSKFYRRHWESEKEWATANGRGVRGWVKSESFIRP